MYSDRELSRLAVHKLWLRRRIALRRTQTAAVAARVARPLAWLDRVVAFWRRLSPFTQIAAVPLGLLAVRSALPRRGVLGLLMRWGPLAFGAVRGLGAVFHSRDGSAE